MGLFFCFVFVLLLQAAMHKELNHDEQMYVSSGALLVRSQLPYVDYPYFQMPLPAFVYGVAFHGWGDLLLVARLLNTLFAFGTCLLLFSLVWRLSVGISSLLRIALSAGSVLLYISGSQFIYTSGLAWNHDLPVLLTLVSLALLMPGKSTGNMATRVMFSGFGLGLAASTRLLFLPAIVPFGFAIMLGSNTRSAMGLRRLILFGIGFVLGLLPSLLFLVMSPGEFFFGNVTYHGFNEQYWRSVGYERAMTPAGKLGYAFDVLVSEPSNWLLLLGMLIVLVIVSRGPTRDRVMVVILPFLTAAALFLCALVPTPTWLQYFYAPYAMLAVAFALGTVSLVRTRRRRLAVSLFALVTVVSVAYSVLRYISLGNMLAVDDWAPGIVSRVGREIREAVPAGTVVTLAPIYPLQTGLDIYPGLASGPFGFRVANILSAKERAEHGLISAEEALRLMSERPPEGILAGSEGALEAPLVQFAIERGYKEVELSNGLSLWVRPDR
ncbi:MAG: hypothetical protein WCD37_12920 [Chloroflexia bacterium]